MVTNAESDRFRYFDVSPKHRYLLTRKIPGTPGSNNKGTLLFIMLNPSTANEVDNDRTIERCMSFTKELGYDLLKVVNLFSWIETDSKKLKTIDAHELVDEKTDEFIKKSIDTADEIIVAWGDEGAKLGADRIDKVMKWINKPVHCLEINNSGSPQHPLYVKGNICERSLKVWPKES